MRLALQILTYTYGILALIGLLSFIDEGGLTMATFIASLVVEAQCVLTLVYVHKHK